MTVGRPMRGGELMGPTKNAGRGRGWWKGTGSGGGPSRRRSPGEGWSGERVGRERGRLEWRVVVLQEVGWWVQQGRWREEEQGEWKAAQGKEQGWGGKGAQVVVQVVGWEMQKWWTGWWVW